MNQEEITKVFFAITLGNLATLALRRFFKPCNNYRPFVSLTKDSVVEGSSPPLALVIICGNLASNLLYFFFARELTSSWLSMAGRFKEH